jgi:hypothetical protein
MDSNFITYRRFCEPNSDSPLRIADQKGEVAMQIAPSRVLVQREGSG